MDQSKLSYDQIKLQILEVGQGVLCSRGFIGVGLAEILDACGVPKGSFYHYFKSKETFGVALVEHYMSDHLHRLNTLNEGTPAADYRLRVFFQNWMQIQMGRDETRKCLFVRLGPEMDELSPTMQQSLRVGLGEFSHWLSRTVAQGVQQGTVQPSQGKSSEDVAEQLLNIWFGASVMDTIRKDGAAFQSALDQSYIVLGLSMAQELA